MQAFATMEVYFLLPILSAPLFLRSHSLFELLFPLNVIFLWVLSIFSLCVWFSGVDWDVFGCDFLYTFFLGHTELLESVLTSFTRFHVFSCLHSLLSSWNSPLGLLDFSFLLDHCQGSQGDGLF